LIIPNSRQKVAAVLFAGLTYNLPLLL